MFDTIVKSNTIMQGSESVGKIDHDSWRFDDASTSPHSTHTSQSHLSGRSWLIAFNPKYVNCVYLSFIQPRLVDAQSQLQHRKTSKLQRTKFNTTCGVYNVMTSSRIATLKFVQSVDCII